MPDWLSQSIEFQIAVAMGYLCTRVITSSARPKFARDFAIQVFVWAVVVQLWMSAASAVLTPPMDDVRRFGAMAIGSVSGFVTAVVWQVRGFRWTTAILRKCHVTSENFRGGAWETICDRSATVAYVTVRTTDGYVFKSDMEKIQEKMENIEFKPVDGGVNLAEDGIGMHITTVIPPLEEQERKLSDGGIVEREEGEFTEFTFIPMSQITRVSVTRRKDA